MSFLCYLRKGVYLMLSEWKVKTCFIKWRSLISRRQFQLHSKSFSLYFLILMFTIFWSDFEMSEIQFHDNQQKFNHKKKISSENTKSKKFFYVSLTLKELKEFREFNHPNYRKTCYFKFCLFSSISKKSKSHDFPFFFFKK